VGDPLSTSERRSELQRFARRELTQPNQAQAFLNIVQKAIELSADLGQNNVPGRSSAIIGDIQAVLIGDDLQEGRGSGPHYVGRDYIFGRPSQGFNLDLQMVRGKDGTWESDEGQVQHAAAALVIAFHYGDLGIWWAKRREKEGSNDALLYDALSGLGKWLDDLSFQAIAAVHRLEYPRPDLAKKLEELPGRIMMKICDESCHLPAKGEQLDPPADFFDFETDAASGSFDFKTDAASGGFNMAESASMGSSALLGPEATTVSPQDPSLFVSDEGGDDAMSLLPDEGGDDAMSLLPDEGGDDAMSLLPDEGGDDAMSSEAADTMSEPQESTPEDYDYSNGSDDVPVEEIDDRPSSGGAL